MTKRKDAKRGFLEEAERIEREEVQGADADRRGRWVFVRSRPAKEPSQVYSVRLPVTVVEELRLLASARGEAPTGLIRDWVLERLDEEIERLPAAEDERSIPPKVSAAGSSTGRTRTKAKRSGRARARRKTSRRKTG